MYYKKNGWKVVFFWDSGMVEYKLNLTKRSKNHGLSRGPSSGFKSRLPANSVAFQILVADLKDIDHCESSQHLFLCTLND